MYKILMIASLLSGTASFASVNNSLVCNATSFEQREQTEKSILTRMAKITSEHGKDILEDHVPDILSHLKEFYDNGGMSVKDCGEALFHVAVAIQEKAGLDEQYIPEVFIILFNAYAGYDQLSMTIERLYSLKSINFLFAVASSNAAYNHLKELFDSQILREFHNALFLTSI